MSGHQVEVIHRDPAPAVDLLHWRAGVRLGSAECGGEEFDLLAFEPFHVRPGEKARQVIVVKHAAIEVLDDDLQGLVGADPAVDAVNLGHANPSVLWHRESRSYACRS